MSNKTQHILLEETIESHKGIIHKIARSYCQDIESRKDLIQEILVQIWKSLNSYNPEYKMSTWIYRIALNVAISFRNKEVRRKKQKEDYRYLQIIDYESLSELEPNSDYELLQTCIATIKEVDKALIILHLEGHDNQEIAQIMGISVSNVSTRLYRIKNRLQSKFLELKK